MRHWGNGDRARPDSEAVLGDLDGITCLLEEATPEGIDHGTKALYHAATLGRFATGQLGQRGVKALARVSLKQKANVEAKIYACKALRTLAWAQEELTLVAVPSLLDLLRGEEKRRVKLAALEAMKVIVGDGGEADRQLRDGGGVRTLLHIAKWGGEGRGIASDALARVSKASEEAAEEIGSERERLHYASHGVAFEKSPMEQLVDEALNETETERTKAALQAIWENARSDEDVKRLGGTHGAGAICSRALRPNAPEDVVEIGACVARELAPSAAFAHELMASGAIGHISAALASGKIRGQALPGKGFSQQSQSGRMVKTKEDKRWMKVVEDAAACLNILIWGPWLAESDKETEAEEIAKISRRSVCETEGMVENVVAIVESGGERAREEAAGVLIALAVSHKEEFIKSGAVLGLTGALWAGSWKVQEASVMALYALASEDEARDEMVEAGAVEALKRIVVSSESSIARQFARRLAIWLFPSVVDPQTAEEAVEPFLQELRMEAETVRERAMQILEGASVSVSDFSWAVEAQKQRIRLDSGLRGHRDRASLSPEEFAGILKSSDALEAARQLQGVKLTKASATLARLPPSWAATILEHMYAHFQARLYPQLQKPIRSELRKDAELRAAMNKGELPTPAEVRTIFNDASFALHQHTMFDRGAYEAAKGWFELDASEIAGAIMHAGASLGGAVLPLLDEDKAAQVINELGVQVGIRCARCYGNLIRTIAPDGKHYWMCRVLARTPTFTRRAMYPHLTRQLQMTLLLARALPAGALTLEKAEAMLMDAETSGELVCAVLDELTGEQTQDLTRRLGFHSLAEVLDKALGSSLEAVANCLGELPVEVSSHYLGRVAGHGERPDVAASLWEMLDDIRKSRVLNAMASMTHYEGIRSLLECLDAKEIAGKLMLLFESSPNHVSQLLSSIGSEHVAEIGLQLAPADCAKLINALRCDQRLHALVALGQRGPAGHACINATQDSAIAEAASTSGDVETFECLVRSTLETGKAARVVNELRYTDRSALFKLCSQLNGSTAISLLVALADECPETCGLALSHVDHDTASRTASALVDGGRAASFAQAVKQGCLGDELAAELVCSTGLRRQSMGRIAEALPPHQLGELMLVSKQGGDSMLATTAASNLTQTSGVAMVVAMQEHGSSTEAIAELISLLPGKVAGASLLKLFERDGDVAAGVSSGLGSQHVRNVLQEVEESESLQLSSFLSDHNLPLLEEVVESTMPKELSDRIRRIIAETRSPEANGSPVSETSVQEPSAEDGHEPTITERAWASQAYEPAQLNWEEHDETSQAEQTGLTASEKREKVEEQARTSRDDKGKEVSDSAAVIVTKGSDEQAPYQEGIATTQPGPFMDASPVSISGDNDTLHSPQLRAFLHTSRHDGNEGQKEVNEERHGSIDSSGHAEDETKLPERHIPMVGESVRDMLQLVKKQPAAVGPIFDRVGRQGQEQIAKAMDDGEVDDVLADVRSDAAARLLMLLEPSKRSRRLGVMPARKREAVVISLRSAGGRIALPSSCFTGLGLVSNEEGVASAVAIIDECKGSFKWALQGVLASSKSWSVPTTVLVALSGMLFPTEQRRGMQCLNNAPLEQLTHHAKRMNKQCKHLVAEVGIDGCFQKVERLAQSIRSKSAERQGVAQTSSRLLNRLKESDVQQAASPSQIAFALTSALAAGLILASGAKNPDGDTNAALSILAIASGLKGSG